MRRDVREELDPLLTAMERFGAFIDARTGEIEICFSDDPVDEVAWSGPTIAGSAVRTVVGRTWDRALGRLIVIV